MYMCVYKMCMGFVGNYIVKFCIEKCQVENVQAAKLPTGNKKMINLLMKWQNSSGAGEGEGG